MVVCHRVERQAGEHADEVADVHGGCTQQECGVAEHQNPAGQHECEHHVELAEDADALINTGCCRHDCHENRDNNEADLSGSALVNAEHNVQAHVEHDHADTERGCNTEDGAKHRCDVDGVAHAALDALAEQRVERRADCQRKSLAVGEVAQGDAHERVHAPAGDAVVEQRPHGAFACRVKRSGFRHGRRQVLRCWFGNREEHHVGADAGCEQHGCPRERRVFGPVRVFAQADLGVPQGEYHHEHQNCGGQQDVEPAEPVADPSHEHAECRLGRLREEQRPPGDQRDEHAGHAEHNRLDLGAGHLGPKLRFDFSNS